MTRRVEPPPHDIGAEASVLGSIVLDAVAIAKVADWLNPEDFYWENNGLVLRAALNLHRAGTPIDITTLATDLEKLGKLERIGGRAHLAQLQEECPTAANVEHYGRIVKDRAERRRLLDQTKASYEQMVAALRDPAVPLHGVMGLKGRPVGVLLADVAPEPVRWLWPGRIPLGKLTVLDGDPGLGKSTITLDIAARVTRGLAMPDGSPGVEGGVVILTAEDGLADTVRPRLDAAGGDPSRVVALPVVGHGDQEHEPVLPDDLEAVESAIARVRAVLVIVDPLMAYLAGAVNANRDQDVRRALRQCASLAEGAGAAAFVVRHLTKVGTGNPLYRGGGSIGIIGAARAGLLVARDPEDEGRRVLACTKANLGPEPPSLAYELRDTGTGVATVNWLGGSLHSAMSLLAAGDEDEDSKTMVAEVMEFLGDYLAEPRPADDAKRQAMRKTGASERTVMTAKKKLGVRSRKGAMDGGWRWELPAYPEGSDEGEDRAAEVIPLRPKDARRMQRMQRSEGLHPSHSSLHPSGPEEVRAVPLDGPGGAAWRLLNADAMPVLNDRGEDPGPFSTREAAQAWAKAHDLEVVEP